MRPWIDSIIDFGFWIGAKNEAQARKRVERNYKKKRYSFTLETINEDPSGPLGKDK
mgnify:FL=1|tara:strand:+ start:170 stop:337 length:168 start_codon:yes stop_codon:yes gene_type:complete